MTAGPAADPERFLQDLGFAPRAASVIADHLRDADARGKASHGLARLPFIAGLEGLDPAARPRRLEATPSFERWQSGGAIGYVVMDAICEALIEDRPEPCRLVVVEACFPTGHLGYWARRLAGAGLVVWLTATSPRRLRHPEGGPPLAGTNPLTIGVPSSDGLPLVSDVSMGQVTHGDVLLGRARPEQLVPFGGDLQHKGFALALGLQLLVEALAGAAPGVVLVAAQPSHDPVPGLRELAAGLRLPGDS